MVLRNPYLRHGAFYLTTHERKIPIANAIQQHSKCQSLFEASSRRLINRIDPVLLALSGLVLMIPSVLARVSCDRRVVKKERRGRCNASHAAISRLFAGEADTIGFLTYRTYSWRNDGRSTIAIAAIIRLSSYSRENIH